MVLRRAAPGADGAAVQRPPAGQAGTAVGRAVPRSDGPAKVTGRARYTDDLVVPGAWYGATLRSTEPHARLLAVERDPDFEWSAVVVLTAADVPGDNVVELMADDQPVLAADVIRHVAEPVALVAAPDPGLARAALRHLRLRTEPLPAVLDPLASEVAFARYEFGRGDVEAALASADLVVEASYRTGYQEQLYLEPQAMLAVPDTDGGGATVTGSLQCTYYVHAALARALGLPRDRLVVVQAETGGGFGGKEEFPSGVAVHAALLALRCGRPVRLVYERHEDLVATTKRHPAFVRHRTGVTRDGRLVAQDVEVVLDAGAYETLSRVVLSRGAIHAAGPYRCPNVRVRARTMRTNTPPNGAMRGFGAPQVEFAAELQVERVAEALRLSPAELRRRWAYRVGDVTPTGQVLRQSVAAVPVLERALEASAYEAARGRSAASRAARKEVTASPIAHGVGLALGWHGAGFTGRGEARLASVAGVALTAEGAIHVLTASTEIGQGARTVLPLLVAEALGLPSGAVTMPAQDTARVPDSGPTVASRTTMVVGGLLVVAARRLRAEVEARTGQPFAASYRADAASHGPTRVEERFGGYPHIEWDDERHVGDAYPCFSWACDVAEVDVDLDTGAVEVRRMTSVADAGRLVHPLLAAGQVEGGTLQGVGWATLEELTRDEGRLRQDRLATYLVPTALDAPPIETHFVEEPFGDAPHGAKGLGELPMDLAAPAVVAAIHDATGVWVDELPATPERVLAALEGARVEAGRAAR
ncbi:MAG TPA: xanthine dehydrogenase family protein molybdopterin-binding subunit [Candidatus Limnocylindrales bacterium]